MAALHLILHFAQSHSRLVAQLGVGYVTASPTRPPHLHASFGHTSLCRESLHLGAMWGQGRGAKEHAGCAALWHLASAGTIPLASPFTGESGKGKCSKLVESTRKAVRRLAWWIWQECCHMCGQVFIGRLSGSYLYFKSCHPTLLHSIQSSLAVFRSKWSS